MQTPQGYRSVIEGREKEIFQLFLSAVERSINQRQTKEKKRKETNSAQHKAKYLSLFKFGLEKSPSSAYSVYLLMYVSSIFVLGICC